MLFYKSLVSFVTAIALASSVTASATPERRQSCHTGSLVCCLSTNSFNSVDPVLQSDLLGLVDFPGPVDTSLLVGLECVVASLCVTQAACCKGVQNFPNDGFLNVGVNCVNV